MSGKVLDRTMSVFGNRVSRRGLLARAAVVASAMTVAPIRYLTRPVSAASIVRCSGCSGGAKCCDGWTAFCCQLPGGDNRGCPSYAYVAGWWQCNYSDSALCNPTNVRYYLDCNRKPGSSCPQGCHCANNTCSNRGTCCNVFRYGQCNTHVKGVTEVVCRLVTCISPCKIGCLDCNCSSATSQVTCGHNADCL